MHCVYAYDALQCNSKRVHSMSVETNKCAWHRNIHQTKHSTDLSNALLQNYVVFSVLCARVVN